MTPTTTFGWDTLDTELGRWLRARATVRAECGRTGSPLDGVAMALRRVRTTLGFLAAGIDSEDAASVALVTRSYRWAIRIARELDTIEREALEPVIEWARVESFAPFALAFFDSVVAGAFASAASCPEASRLRRELDGVLAPFSIAAASSALAA